MEYKVIDWAYNRMFPNKTFKTFENALSFLDERFNEEEMQEIFIVEIDTRCYANGYWSTTN